MIRPQAPVRRPRSRFAGLASRCLLLALASLFTSCVAAARGAESGLASRLRPLVAVMATAYRLVDAGKLDLERTVTLRAEDKVP